NGSGRTYTITYQATDASGNTAQASATVTVKHNR
ncbi:MAG: HYR domain-containing protein, partial [Candidatus Bathyarchaeia archaeon]